MISYRLEVNLPTAPSVGQRSAQADAVIGAKLTEMGMVVQRFVQEETPLGASKLLRGSIFSEPRGTPIREVVIGSPQMYAQPVERGRRPGKAPLRVEIVPGKRKPQVKRLRAEALELWVLRKLGIGGEEGRKVAVAIALKIGRVGTKGSAMFFKGLQRARPVLDRLSNEMGAAIVAEWEKN